MDVYDKMAQEVYVSLFGGMKQLNQHQRKDLLGYIKERLLDGYGPGQIKNTVIKKCFVQEDKMNPLVVLSEKWFHTLYDQSFYHEERKRDKAENVDRENRLREITDEYGENKDNWPAHLRNKYNEED